MVERTEQCSISEMGKVCATCTKQLETGRYYSLDTLVDLTTNVDHLLESQLQFKSEEDGPNNLCTECFSKALLFCEFHQQFKHSVMEFGKHTNLAVYDIDVTSTSADIKEEKEIESNKTNQPTKKTNILTKNSKPNKLYKCPFCDAVYNKYKAFMHHRNMHNPKYVCSYCGKASRDGDMHKIHERIHTGERPFVCGKCGNTFTSNGALSKHLVSHVKKRLFKCEICEKTFKSKSVLSRHIHIHTGIKRHKCTKCDASFVQACNLQRHLQTHEKEAVKGRIEKC